MLHLVRLSVYQVSLKLKGREYSVNRTRLNEVDHGVRHTPQVQRE